MSSAGGYQERGATRSGTRFARTNEGYFTSLAELLRAHERLQEEVSPISLRYFRLGITQGSLLQATLRFSTSCENIGRHLLHSFMQLFREHAEGPQSGFEVLVTFNAVLVNREGNSFSVFYGHDYRATNLIGAADELQYGEEALTVRTLADVSQLPTRFDFERLAVAYRHAFEHSNLRVARFLNVIYLVYRYVPPPPSRARRARGPRDERPH